MGLKTIADIAKERLRRAAKKVREEWAAKASAGINEPDLLSQKSPPTKPQCPDLGFRVFKLDTSNIKAWEPKKDDLVASLTEHTQNLKDARSEQDILFELLLKLGLDLTVPIEQKTIAGKKVHSIGAGTLIACLAQSIGRKDAEPLALGIVAWHKALKPAGETTVVFRDNAFADDVAKTNLTAILEQHGLENVRSL